MAVFKVVTRPDGRAIGKKSPKRLENYLKYETDEKGNLLTDPKTGMYIPRDAIISAINGDAEDFSLSLRETFAQWNVNRGPGDKLYHHYVQSFPPEDNEKMTREQCHRLGVELAETVFGDFPVLVTTHFDQENDGKYHWHSHFMVGNCNVHTGKKLDTSRGMLWAQKRFTAAQADAAGLTRRGLVLQDGEILPSEAEERLTFAEWQMEKRFKKANAEAAKQANKKAAAMDRLTQKAELRFVIRAAASQTSSFAQFSDYLLRVYNVKVKKTRGVLSFLHPDRVGLETRHGGGWIRGRSLGKLYETEESLYALNESGYRGIGGGGNSQEAAEAAAGRDTADFIRRYRELYPELFADPLHAEKTGSGDSEPAEADDGTLGKSAEGIRRRGGKAL